jgi:exosortase
VSWALAFEVVGMTLLMVYAVFGAWVLARVAFPIAYFLVAVPWPIPLVEQPVIQGLTRLDARVCTELFGWLGIPVIPHGNVIELANGMVGIDEACSGIRSFQATLMISLFLGEFYCLKLSRRLGLVLAGFTLSFVFNAARMSLLVWVASRQGVAAIAKWHDPAGVTILLGCFLGLWWLGIWLGKKQKAEMRKIETFKPDSKVGPTINYQLSTINTRFAVALCVWLAVVELAVQGWYRWHAARLPAAVTWSVNWPVTLPGFKELPVPAVTRQILRYDEGRSATWSADGLDWQVVFLRWNPGRTAVHLAKNHTPNVCLTAAGHTLNIISPEVWLDVNGLRLPFSVNQVMDSSRPLFVYYCLWDDCSKAEGFSTMDLTAGNRLAPVLAGLRNPGQRSLEILVAGPDNAASAEAAVRAGLQKLVKRGQAK